MERDSHAAETDPAVHSAESDPAVDPADPDPVVVALGGNTLLGEQGPWTIDEQREAVAATARHVAAAIRAGHRVVLTHGNGPQVGNLLLQQEGAPETPQLPLDVLVAETQAQIGYLLQQALDNELAGGTDADPAGDPDPDGGSAGDGGPEDDPLGVTDFVTVVTQTVVDRSDPAFEDPTKPVGPFYTEREAAEKPFETRRVSSGDRPCRRVVPSPDPTGIVEADEIARLVDRGDRVVCVGGGGVPVVRDGGLRGVEAVVDKDLASALLASEIGASALVILTDVEHAYVDFDGPDRRPLGEVTPGELRDHLEAGEFGAGSMRPKVEACLRFVEDGGRLAAITTPENLDAALAGDAGTRVVA